MKRIVLVLSVLSLAQLCSPCLNGKNQKESNKRNVKKENEYVEKEAVNTFIEYMGRIYNISGIGCGINTIIGDPVSDNIIIRNDIFDPSFLNKKIREANPYIIGGSTFSFEQGNSIEEVNKKIAASYSLETSGSLNVKKIFSLSASQKFAINGEINTKNHSQSYFYHANARKNSYKYSLKNLSNLSDFKSNLDSDYLICLDDAVKNKNYFKLFNQYGTHVIMGGTYGGCVDAYYTLTSNSLDLDINSELSVSTTASASITKKLGKVCDPKLDVSSSFDIKAQYGVSTSNTEESFNAKSYGGNGFFCSSVNDLDSKIENWGTTVTNNEALIDLKEQDNLISLWDLLPVKYGDTVKNEMIEAFNTYSELYGQFDGIYSFDLKKSTICNYNVDELSFSGNSEKTINLTETGAKPSIMKKVGYNKVRLNIEFGYKSNENGSKGLIVYSKNKYGNYNYLTGISLSNNSSNEYLSRNRSLYVNINSISDSDEIFLVSDGVDFSIKKLSLKIEYSLC